ncbi:uncharacterized protein METZ01_LOCUS201050, partial [marine metagenome]
VKQDQQARRGFRGESSACQTSIAGRATLRLLLVD